MEKNMGIQLEVLHLMTERIRVLSRLKELYLKKQKLMMDAHAEGLKELAVVQRSCLEDLINLENRWRSLITRLKNASHAASDHTDIIISLSLKEDDITEYFAYRDQLHQTVLEIDRIKKNNDLLTRNALPLTLQKTQRSHSRAEIKSRSSLATSFLRQTLLQNRTK
jgi:hypothetical protein